MGLQLTYTANNRTLNVRFSLADWATINEVRNHVPDAVDAAFATLDFGVQVLVATSELVAAVDAMDQLFELRPELLPYTYQQVARTNA